MHIMIKGVLMGCAMMMAFSAGTVHATVDWNEGFEYANDTAMLAVWASSCTANNGAMDVSSTRVHSGTKSLKEHFNGAEPPNATCFQDRNLSAFSPTLYTSYWVYIDTFTWLGGVPTKSMFQGQNGAYPSFWWGFFGTQNTTNTTPTLGVTAQGITLADGTVTTINALGGTVPVNQWACLETRLTMSSPGGADGIMQSWINGVQALNITNQRMRPLVSNTAQLTSSTAQFQFVRLYTQHGAGDIYYDDLQVSRDARIGCGGAIPPGDTTPPNPVTGLAVSTAGAATWNATTDNTGGSGLASYTLLRCTGTCTPSVTLTTTGPSTLSYSDLSVVAGTTYSYAIKATDNSGNSTAQSATVQMTAAATTRTVLATYTPSGTGSDLGAMWDPGYTGNLSCQLVSSKIETSAVNPSAGCMETFNTSSPNDAWGQVPLTNFGGTQTMQSQVLLRWANAPTPSGYMLVAQGNNAFVHTGIYKVTNGAFTALIEENAAPWATGDSIRGEVQGSTIKLYRVFASSESLILSYNDATYATGKVGLGIYLASSSSALTDVQLGTFTMGSFGASSPPSISTVTNVSRTQATVTWDLTTLPTNIRAWTGNSPVATVTAPLSSFPSGVYTYPPTILNGLTDYICFIAQDSGGVEIAGSQKCASVPAAPIDTNPAVVTLSAPTSTLPAGTTSTTLAVTLDKPATCKNDTANPAGTDLAAYTGMANAMTTASLTSSGTITGLSAGTVNYYVRCDFVDVNNVDHPNTTSLTIPVTVAASTPDTVAPSDVTGNAATVVSPTQVSASWNAATPHGTKTITGYQVAISYGAGNTTYNLVGLPVTATNIITDVLPNTVVNVVVKAIDSSNVLSANWSNISTVTTPAVVDTAVPSTMTHLSVTRTFANSVVVTADPCVNTSGACTTIYEISPAGCAAFVFIYSRVTLEAELGNLASNTAYCLRGKFSNGTNQSLSYSDIVTFTTASSGLSTRRATLPFGVTRDSVTRSSAGTRAVRP